MSCTSSIPNWSPRGKFIASISKRCHLVDALQSHPFPGTHLFKDDRVDDLDESNCAIFPSPRNAATTVVVAALSPRQCLQNRGNATRSWALPLSPRGAASAALPHTYQRPPLENNYTLPLRSRQQCICCWPSAFPRGDLMRCVASRTHNFSNQHTPL